VGNGLLARLLRGRVPQVGRSDGWPPKLLRELDRIPPTGRLTVTTPLTRAKNGTAQRDLWLRTQTGPILSGGSHAETTRTANVGFEFDHLARRIEGEAAHEDGRRDTSQTHAVMHAVSVQAHRWGWITTNPAGATRPLRTNTPEKRNASPSEALELASSFSGTPCPKPTSSSPRSSENGSRPICMITIVNPDADGVAERLGLLGVSEDRIDRGYDDPVPYLALGSSQLSSELDEITRCAVLYLTRECTAPAISESARGQRIYEYACTSSTCMDEVGVLEFVTVCHRKSPAATRSWSMIS